MGSQVQADFARQLLTAVCLSRAGRCAALAALMLALGSRGLETAIANGDTRTLTMHHIHTDEDITITYKRDGKYDEEALKQLDWFVRDWRQSESIHMDPQLYDLVWEVSREAGGDKIDVVCGYRSPRTNAMLRRRSSGVAEHSQHMLGKAMDFYVPGAALEDLRAVGLRLQRGGVGYYPHSGAPFVHLDTGPVRHWGPTPSGREQIARIAPNGRTAHGTSDGHPDTEKGAHAAGVSMAAAASKDTSPDEDDDDAEAAAHAAAVSAAATRAPAGRRGNYSLASVESRPVVPSPSRQVRTLGTPLSLVPQTPAPVAAAPQAVAAADAEPVAAQPERRDWTYATEAPRPPEPLKGTGQAAGDGDTTGAMPWLVRQADTDHVPLEHRHVLCGPAATRSRRGARHAPRGDWRSAAPHRCSGANRSNSR